jgi:hypothetical protein
MDRIYHTWDKWECYPAGFYETSKPGSTKDECEEVYRELLSNCELFAQCLEKIIVEWKNSCEHYLSNPNMNRIAWLGQAALAYKYNIPACYRGGYNRLTNDEKKAADGVALRYLNKWLTMYGQPELTTEECKSKTKANIY